MNFFRLVFELFTLYLLYKLIFDFIIPVAKTTKQVKKQFNEMSSRMQETMQQQHQQQNAGRFQPGNNSSSSNNRNDDYIEFEEVK